MALTPNSPEWWFRRLADYQINRLPHLHRMHRYAVGEHDLPEGARGAKETYRAFQRRARSNYTGLVAESVLERLSVTGFRTGTGSSARDDADSWRIWQANHLDADFPLVMRSALYMGESYMMVGSPADSRGGSPLITPEDPREMVAEMDPIDKRVVRAALKVWPDEISGVWRSVLLLPDAFYAFTAPLPNNYTPRTHHPDDAWGLGTWEPAGSEPNPIGRVPVVRFANRLDLNGRCMAEFEDVIDIQDRVNNEILNRLVISKMQAYRQRWVKGVVFEDEDGNSIAPWQPGADLVWATEDPDAEFGEFQQADLRQIIDAVSADVRDLGAISRTPPHYLLGEFINAGGDAFTQSETGHVAKVTERMRHFGEGAEEVVRMAYAYLRDPRAMQLDSEVIWADPQYRSLAEKADAAVKLSAAGIPWRTVVTTVLGYSPQEADRMESERASDALLTQLAAPAPAPPTNAPQNATQQPEEPNQTEA